MKWTIVKRQNEQAFIQETELNGFILVSQQANVPDSFTVILRVPKLIDNLLLSDPIRKKWG